MADIAPLQLLHFELKLWHQAELCDSPTAPGLLTPISTIGSGVSGGTGQGNGNSPPGGDGPQGRDNHAGNNGSPKLGGDDSARGDNGKTGAPGSNGTLEKHIRPSDPDELGSDDGTGGPESLCGSSPNKHRSSMARLHWKFAFVEVRRLNAARKAAEKELDTR